MVTVVDNGYVGKAIDDLISVLGVKARVSEEMLLGLLRQGKVQECTDAIARQLGLPIKINLVWVPKNFVRGSTERFDSKDLAQTDDAGHGIEGIFAQVSIPHLLPLFGSSALTNYPISVRLTEGCHKQPFTFITTMAHELSHILLHALMHPHRDSEVYTDLVPLVLGFAETARRGRKDVTSRTHALDGTITTTTTTTTYGYLSDPNFSFARNRIANVRDTRCLQIRRVSDRVKRLEGACTGSREALSKLHTSLEYLDSHRSRPIRRGDAAVIVKCHSPTYAGELQSAISASDAVIEAGRSLCSDSGHYTEKREDDLVDLENDLDPAAKELDSTYHALLRDLRILRRNLSLLRRVRAMHNDHARGIRMLTIVMSTVTVLSLMGVLIYRLVRDTFFG